MTQKQNILFVMTDQQRVDTLGAYGNTFASTPHLDALATSGMRFDRCYTPTALCTPARASLLTGTAPFRHKLLTNYERNTGYQEDLLPGTFTFSQELVRQDYNCGLVGKWHVGAKRTPSDFGFDGIHLPGWHNPVDHIDYLSYLHANDLPPRELSDEIRCTSPNGGGTALLAARLKQPVEATFEYYLGTRTIEMLDHYAADRASTGKPFFLALHFFGPHLPYVVPSRYFDMFDPDRIKLPRSIMETFSAKPPVQRNYSAYWGFDTMPIEVSRKLVAIYWGYITLIDEQIGRVMAALRERNLVDTTAVFFTSDHGEFTGAHRLHDKGPAMYEDIYRTAGLVRIPSAPAGQVCDEFVTLMDCTATILDLAGADPSLAVDGRSLVKMVHRENQPWPEDIVCEFHGHHFPYAQRMLRTKRYKLVINPESVNELYDLESDPDELLNIYTLPERASLRAALSRRLYDVLRQRGDNFFHWMTEMSDIGRPDTACP
jgi:arylsulfatase A-like enzyme